MFAKVARLFHTVRYLRPIQLYGRLAAVLRRVRPNHRPPPAIRPIAGRWSLAAWRATSVLAPNRFRFLNEEQDLVSASDWNNAAWPRLWTYNLHYFDDLDSVDAVTRSDWHVALIERWIVENPPPRGAGWEPYCLSLRIVNWCRFAWAGGILTPPAIQSLAVQIRALRDQLEVHLLGNHLWANAKALIFGGLFFAGPEADRWLATGLKLLRQELGEQILTDGGHFERSPMYHNIVTGDVLDLLEADRLSPGCLPADLVHELRRSAEAMLGWAEVMTHPDGELSFFNDAAMSIAPPLAALRGHASAAKLTLPAMLGERLRHLPSSGYIRAEISPALLLVDVGDIGPDYLPGHAHADTLSCEISLHGRRLVVNSGTSVYAVGAQRNWERGTPAHNTVVVDGRDSSEVWSSFRVARRARVRAVEAHDVDGRIVIVGAHDGYRRLPGQVTHVRRWTLADSELLVDDHLSGRPKRAEAFWYFHPDVSVEAAKGGEFLIHRDGVEVARVAFMGGAARLEGGAWAPEFGLLVPNVRLCATFDGVHLVTRWRWSAPSRRPRLRR